MKKNYYFVAISTAIFFILFLSRQIFAAEIILKKNPGKSVQAKILEITNKGIKVELTYALSDIKSINGVKDFNRFDILAISKYEKYAEEVERLKKLEKSDPSNPSIIWDISRALEKSDRWTEALPYALKLVETNPNDPKAHTRLGNVYRHRQTRVREKAIAEYKTALELEGPTAYNQWELGYTYMIFKEYDKAVSYFEKAIAMGPARGRFYQSLGNCYLSLGKTQEAIAAFQTVLDKYDEEHVRAYEGLGKAYEALGQSEKAAECKRKAEELG